MNVPGMDHGAGPTGSPSIDALVLALRLGLLLSTAALAGVGLACPFARSPGHRLAVFAWAAGAVSAAAGLITLQVVPHTGAPLVLVHVVLVLALPLLLRRPKAAAADGAALVLLLLAETALDHTGVSLAADALAVLGIVGGVAAAVLQLTASSIRLLPLALGGAAALVAAGLVQAASSGLGLDRRLYDTGYGLLVLTVIAAPIVAVVLGWRLRAGGLPAAVAGILSLAFLAWAALPALPQPAPLPTPALPLLAHLADGTPLLVSPLRPGANLVHFPDSAGDGLFVTAENGLRVRATPRMGAEGTWAEVELPVGHSDLTIDRGGAASTVQVDTGAEPPLPSAVGDDGPECASAALGRLVAGSRAPLTGCPSDALAPADATALRRLVGYLAARDTPGITIAGDDSPRSRQAAQVVRDSAAQAGVPATDAAHPSNALIDVAGWSRSAQLLGEVADGQSARPTYTAGVYLAPWLLHAPVISKVPTSFLPLRFNPRAEQALSYAVALENAFGQQSPSIAGFDQWLTAHHTEIQGPVTLYASAQVSVMSMDMGHDMPGMGMGGDHPGQWVSNATIVPVSMPL